MGIPKPMRMSRSADFRIVREKGKTFTGKHLILAILPSSTLSFPKIGLITPKHLGKAVDRNRIRRRLRHIFHQSHTKITSPTFIVTIARKKAMTANFTDLKKEWTFLAKKAEIL